MESKTRKGALFLSLVSLFNGEIAQQIQFWFSNFPIENGLQDDSFRDFTVSCWRNPAERKAILGLMRELDLGIEDIYVTEPFSEEDRTDAAKNEFPADRSHRIYIRHFVGGLAETSNDPNNYVLFDLDKNESQGTRKLVAMAGPLWSILHHGNILFVDELDARLHPLMTRRIIELFHSPLTNPKGAQLIFATHDTNLLDKTLFRRDQIWFAEKDRQGATHLASLAEYRVRSDAAFEKQYLEGRYGAIPFLGDLSRLPWAQEQGDTQEAAEQETVHA